MSEWVKVCFVSICKTNISVIEKKVYKLKKKVPYGLLEGLDIHCLYRREASVTQLSISYLHASPAIKVFTYLMKIKGEKKWLSTHFSTKTILLETHRVNLNNKYVYFSGYIIRRFFLFSTQGYRKFFNVSETHICITYYCKQPVIAIFLWKPAFLLYSTKYTVL